MRVTSNTKIANSFLYRLLELAEEGRGRIVEVENGRRVETDAENCEIGVYERKYGESTELTFYIRENGILTLFGRPPYKQFDQLLTAAKRGNKAG